MKSPRLALLSLLAAGAIVLGSSLDASAASIYWISFHPADDTPSANAATAGFTQAPDVGYTQLLEANGHNVTRVLSSDIPNASLLNAADLVVISRSVPSGHYELDAETSAWNGLTAPTMILGGYILRNNRLGYTSGTTIPDTTSAIRLSVTDPNHPLFDGISLDVDGMTVNPFAEIQTFQGPNGPVVQRGISVNTSPLAGGGTLLASVGTAGDPAVGGMIIGEWQAGSVMGTTPADTLGGHRLVFLTGSRENSITSEGAGMFDLTADGSRMFLNAVGYMAVPEPSTLGLLGLGGLALLWRFRKR